MTVCYLVEKRIVSLGDELADYSYAMFHGYARRPGASYPGKEYRFGERLRNPLHWTANVHRMPEICQPNLAWIVAEPVKEALAGLPHMAFLQVQFDKLFDVPYRRGEGNEYREESDEYLLEQTHDPQLSHRLDARYELIVAIHDEIEPRLKKGAPRVQVPVESSSEPLELELSEEIFQSHPIFWKTEHFLREDVFGAVASRLDRDFFACSRIEIPSG